MRDPSRQGGFAACLTGSWSCRRSPSRWFIVAGETVSIHASYRIAAAPQLNCNRVRHMTRLVLKCDGIPSQIGNNAAEAIAQEFREHRPWYANVRCTFDGRALVLDAQSDSDIDGSALVDEFSDCLSAYIVEPFDGTITVQSVAA
jgi:hypothetical protein